MFLVPPNSEYMKMRDKLLKMNKMQDVSASHILVLLLRLRQICCHPTLISSVRIFNDFINSKFNIFLLIKGHK